MFVFVLFQKGEQGQILAKKKMKRTKSVICFLLAAITMIVMVCPVAAFAKPETDDDHMLTEEKTVVCENEDEALTVTCTNLNVRRGPGTEYDIIGSLSHGDTVRRTCVMDNGWSQILYNGILAYCSSSYLTPVRFNSVNEPQKVTSNTLNVRSGPGTMWDVIGTYESGDAVRRIGVGTNGWSKIVYNGTTAYCYSSYLDDVTFKAVDQTVYVSGTSVNVRSGACKEFSKIGSLSKGQSVTRTGVGDNGWSKIVYNGTTAYCYSSYLKTNQPISYPLTYSDSTCNITITKEWYGASSTTGAWCYIAHVQFTNYKRLFTTCANGRYNNGYETTSHAAKRTGAILAVNGDYSAPSLNYIVVRKGVICNGGDRNLWVPAIYSNRNGLLLSAWETGGTPGIAGRNVTELVNEGSVTDTFCFGPPILVDGNVVAGDSTSRAQRTLIGTNGTPGDIWIVVTEGRKVDGVSAGLTAKECAKLLKSKGCTFGIPLDGGGSSTMVFQGKVLNTLQGGQERPVVDFLCFK